MFLEVSTRMTATRRFVLKDELADSTPANADRLNQRLSQMRRSWPAATLPGDILRDRDFQLHRDFQSHCEETRPFDYYERKMAVDHIKGQDTRQRARTEDDELADFTNLSPWTLAR
jgi:hypothetical protein